MTHTLRATSTLLLAVLLVAAPLGPTMAARAADEALQVRSAVRAAPDPTPEVRLTGSGWGHGVGMSQWGAFAMAQEGFAARDILTTYYPGTAVTTDTRASTQRIRVGIASGVGSSVVEAVDASVAWQVCSPPAEATGPRPPAASCVPWFTQAAGERLRVAPLPATAVGAPVQLDTSDGAGGLRSVPGPGDAGDDGPITNGDGQVAPAGGLLVERAQGGSWVPHRAYATAAGDRLPVARVAHGEALIRADSYVAPQRLYTGGWRDLHLVGEPGVPAGHRLTVVQDVDTVERYLRGLAESFNSWPEAALQAQAIAGRTYALRGARLGVCLCDRLATPADQVFIGESLVREQPQGDRWAAAVVATADQVLTYQGSLAETYYSSSHGGRSENVEDSWAYGTTPLPYLRSIEDPWSLTEANPNRRWTATATNATVASLLSAGQATPIARVERVRILSRTDGGTPRELQVTGSTAAGARVTFTTDLASRYAKGIAGAAIRRELPVTDGGAATGAGPRVRSSQIERIGLAPFADDDGHLHEYAITWAASAGVVRGLDAERFGPNRAVTRGQMASFLVNTFEVAAPAATGGVFSDVPAGTTHADSIEALVAARVVSGYQDGTFRPEQAVTRAQMASFLAGALALSTDRSGSFVDVTPGAPHASNIEAIAAEGITAGCGDGTGFCPADPVQRGQLTTFLYRLVRG